MRPHLWQPACQPCFGSEACALHDMPHADTVPTTHLVLDQIFMPGYTKSCCFDLTSPGTDKMVSCLMTDSSSESEDKLFLLFGLCCYCEFVLCPIKASLQTSEVKISPFCLCFFKSTFHLCADWSKASFPPADTEHVLKSVMCQWHAFSMQPKNLRVCHNVWI